MAEPALRVLYLLDWLRPGLGVSETLRLVLGPFREAGIQLVVGVLHREPGDFGDELQAQGVPLVDLDPGFPRGQRRVLRVLRTLLQRRIRVIHANEYRAIRLALIAARWKRDVRVIGQLRVAGNVQSGRGGRVRFLRRNSGRLAELVCVSEAVHREFQAATGHGPEHGRVIYNGRPLGRYGRALDAGERLRQRAALRLAPDRPVIAMVASLIPSKDHDTLLRACARIHRCGVSVQVALLGDGPERGRLEALRRELQLDEMVTLFGYRADVERFLEVSDLLVMTSTREGLPGAVIEGQAAGLPAVVTACGGPAEIVRDGVTGFVVPTGNDEAFANALLALIGDERLRRRMSTAAREHVQSFSIDRMLSQWIELYRRVSTH